MVIPHRVGAGAALGGEGMLTSPWWKITLSPRISGYNRLQVIPTESILHGNSDTNL